MALRMEMNFEEVSDKEFFRTKDSLEAIPSEGEEAYNGKKIMFIRILGDAPTSPCAECAPYIGMSHDGSGSTVPLPAILHRGSGTCVCKDIRADFIEGIGEAKKGFGKFEWISRQADDTVTRILGKQRGEWFKDGTVEMPKFYKGTGALSGLGKLVKRNKALSLSLIRRPVGVSEVELEGMIEAETAKLAKRKKKVKKKMVKKKKKR